MKAFNRSLLVLLLILLLSSNVFSQRRGGGNRLLDLLGQTAYSYLLSANRPGYGVDAFTMEKGKTSLSLGISYSDEVIDVPVSLSYGITDNLELSAGSSPFTQSYNFSGSKISGVGDSYLGAKYSFLESDYFIYGVQGIIKIPTASSSKELGTGKVDLYFGLAQGFVKDNFGYDLSFEINLLQRRDFPNTAKYPAIIQNQIDSAKSGYDYTFEPEFVISGGPSVDLSKKISMYAGYSFSRNTRLNYNSHSVYSGIGFVLSKKIGLSLGGSYGLEEAGTWGVSGGLNFLF
jgi:hypothetical protein